MVLKVNEVVGVRKERRGDEIIESEVVVTAVDGLGLITTEEREVSRKPAPDAAEDPPA